MFFFFSGAPNPRKCLKEELRTANNGCADCTHTPASLGRRGRSPPKGDASAARNLYLPCSRRGTAAASTELRSPSFLLAFGSSPSPCCRRGAHCAFRGARDTQGARRGRAWPGDQYRRPKRRAHPGGGGPLGRAGEGWEGELGRAHPRPIIPRREASKLLDLS